MLSSFSPYAPQALMPQPFLGFPQAGPGLPGQQHAYGGSVPYGYDHQAQSPYAFGVPMNPYLQNPYAANPLTPNPQLLQSQLLQNPQLQQGQQFGNAGGFSPAQQLIAVLAQLVQQTSIQSSVIQQLGITLHQLAHQLTAQSLQPQQGAGIGAGQGFGAGVTPFGGIGQSGGAGSPFSAQSAFGATPGGFGGFNPQGWWGGNRSQTIQ
jgi:hypothetical protein